MTASADEALHVRNLLCTRGIPALLVRDERAALSSPLPAVDRFHAVAVVRGGDVAPAQAVLSSLGEEQDGWICEACTERSPAAFETCWRCGRARDDDAEHAEDTAADQCPVADQPDTLGRRAAAWEALLVVFLGCAPSSALWYWSERATLAADWSQARRAAFTGLLSAAALALPVIVLVLRAGRSLAGFGLGRPRLVDLFGAAVLAVLLVELDAALWLALPRDVPEVLRDLPVRAPGDLGYLVPAVAFEAVAFQTAVWGALLPRLSVLLGSTPRAFLVLLVSMTLLFGFGSGPQLVHQAAWLFLELLLFVLVRRVWPVAAGVTLASLLIWLS